MRRFNYIIIMLYYISNTISATDIKKFKFEHFSINEGFSHDRVVSIYQDRQGFMWFGTAEGLNRYDGYEIKIFQYQSIDTTSLSHSQINSIMQDNNDILWFASGYSGLNILQEDGESFIQIHHNPSDSLSLGGEKLNVIFIDHNNDIWVGARLKGGLNRLIANSGRKSSKNKYIFQRFKNNISDSSTISHSSIKTIYEDNDNNLWIGTYNGLNLFERKTGKFKRYLYNENQNNPAADIEINVIYQDKNNNIWVGTQNRGLLMYNIEKDYFSKYNGLSLRSVSSVVQDNKGFIWVGASDTHGIFLLDNNYKFYANLKHNDLDDFSLSDNSIQQIFVDKSGIIWIATDFGGINKYDWKKQRFTHLFKSHDKIYELSDNMVGSILELDSSLVLIGTINKGLDLLNLESGNVKNYRIYLSENEMAQYQNISAIFKDKAGTIWIGAGEGLCIFDYENKRIMHYKNFLNSNTNIKFVNKSVYCFMEDREGILWYGTYGNGLIRFDIKNENFNHYTHNPNNKNGLSGNYIFCIFEDSYDNIWCGNGGLNIYEKNTDEFFKYQSEMFDTKQFKLDYVGYIFEDVNNVFWLSRANDGLLKYDKKNNKLKNYSTKDGLSSNTLWCTLEDKHGILWISSRKGINRFNPNSEIFTNYDVLDGLQSDLFIKNAHFKGESGRFYFGGINGLNIFYPDSIKLNPFIPNLVITDLKIFNKSINPNNYPTIKKSINTIKEIVLSYKDYIFELEFSALEFSIPQKNKYAFKMEGLDSDWIFTDASHRFATYTNLDPGEYNFRVKGSNNDGVWNEKGASIKIIITPPWWQTWWFRFFIGMNLVGLLYWIYRYRTSAIRKNHESQKEFSRKLIDSQEKERKRIATALHDSHGQNLLIISNEMQQYVEKHKGSEKDLKNVTDTVQDSINEIREISYDLHPHILERVGLCEAIDSMIGKICKSTDIQFDLVLDELDNLFDKKVEINIYRIIQEAVNNIIKHSQATESKIEIKKNIKYVNFKISDNGKGFDKNLILKENNGLGLVGMKERVNLINGKYKLKSEQGRGTKIEIKIPIKA